MIIYKVDLKWSNVIDESLSVRLCADEHGIIAHVHVCVCVLCTQLGMCVSWHVRPQHGASTRPVLASWRLNLLRGSTTQWWEVDRTLDDTPAICPWPFPPTRTWCLTALLCPIHLTPTGRERGGVGERGFREMREERRRWLRGGRRGGSAHDEAAKTAAERRLAANFRAK